MIETGIKPCRILLPDTDDFTAWSCIACDQFTGKKKYWKQLAETVKGKKSVLNLILPEAYLNDDADGRIKKINANISKYLSDGTFTELPEGFILTVRKTPYVKRRIGLVGAVDLELYEYSPKSSALIRSTEGTIEERIPPRLKIRENAEAEFSHTMILFDDERCEITESLYERRGELQKVYDFELNMGGGSIEGYFIKDYKPVLEAFSRLLDKDRLIKKYKKDDKFAFAVGDGNHSLATAKAHWERVKQGLSEKERQNHPARYALAEFVNIYDSGIYFEPIYRYITGVEPSDFLVRFKTAVTGKAYVYAGGETVTLDGAADIPTVIKETDAFIKSYISEKGGAVDYIHGEDELKALVDGNSRAVGVLFDSIDKSDLFRYVSEKGAFPRKTFSMGEGEEKRYYLEGRKIR